MTKTIRTFLTLINILLLFLTACSQSAGPFSAADQNQSQPAQNSEEPGESSSADANSGSTAEEDPSSYQPTAEEQGQIDLHIYQVEGTLGTTSEDTTGGEAGAIHNFDQNGVWFEFLGFVPRTYFTRTAENFYQADLEDGSQQSLRYFVGGFQWTTSDYLGYARDWTMKLAD